MEKRVRSFILIAVLIVILGFSLYSFRTKQMSDLYKSKKWVEKRISSKQASRPLTDTIVFNDEILIYDEVDDTFYYSVVESDETYFDPTVATETGSGIRIAFGGDRLTKELIASGETIDLITYRFGESHVSKLACTTLPVLDISIDSDVIEQEGYDDTFLIDEYIPVEMYLYDNSEDYEEYGSTAEDELTSRSIVSDGQIHTRGQTSREWEQKGYKLELLEDKDKPEGDNSKLNLLNIREDDDWILTSAYSDYDKLRNAFASNLWSESFAYDNKWQVENGTCYRFVELFFNGRYHGLYTLSNPFDNKQVDIADGSDECLFKKKDWSMSEFNSSLETNEATGKDWCPGYFLECGDDAGYQQLQDLYVQLMNSSSVEDIRAVQDMDNVIDLWLYFKFTQATDNIYGNNMKNVMVSLKRDLSNPDEYTLLMAPWDMDYTFNYWMDPSEDAPIYLTPITYLMYYRDQDICDEIRDKYATLRQNQWSDQAIANRLDLYEQEVFSSGAYIRNKNRWPDGNYQDGADGEYNLDQFRKYVFDRLTWMDSLVANLDNTYILE